MNKLAYWSYQYNVTIPNPNEGQQTGICTEPGMIVKRDCSNRDKSMARQTTVG